MIKRAYLFVFAVSIISPLIALAGPPFQTDGPEPSISTTTNFMYSAQ